MRIRELRKQNNITQTELAGRLNVVQSAVASWESGKTRPRTELLPVLAKIFGCTVDELFRE